VGATRSLANAKWKVIVNGRILVLALVAAMSGGSAVRAQHNTDMWVGNGGGSVALSPGGLHPGSVYHPLSRVDTFIHGWSLNNPGFDHAMTIIGGVSPLVGPVQIWLEVVALDPALFVIDNAFNVLDSPGDRTLLGGATLHTHLTWFIDETDPGFDTEQCVWKGTFKLIGTGTGLGPSQPFTLLFAIVPVLGGEFPPTSTPANGDFDGDRAVDGLDIAAFSVCMNGPEQRPAPNDPDIATCEVDCFNAFDFNDDMDVDLEDLARLQRVYLP
jgi:hypothetical protein